MTSKNGFGKCSLIDLSKNKKRSLRFPDKENPNACGEGIVRLANRILV